MPGYDGTLRFNTQIDTDGFTKGAGRLEKATLSLKKTFATLGVGFGATALIYKMVQISKESIELASDLQEVQNVVDTAFEDMAYKCEEFAKTSIKNFGMSELAAKQYSSTYMAMAKGIGIDPEAASEMALASTARVGDIASFYNKSFDEANTMMKSVFTGETESLKNIGVVMTETNLEAYRLSQGITTSYSAMSQQEKVALRLNFVLNQTRLAEGDFLRTQDSWANQTRMLTENFNQLKVVVGTGLIQALTPAVKLLNTLLLQLNALAEKFSEFTAGLFGAQTLTGDATSAASAVNSLADAEENLAAVTTKAAKAQEKSTASFDKLNKLGSDESSSGSAGAVGGSSAGVISTSVEVDEAQVGAGVQGAINRLRELLEPLKAISFDNLLNSLSNLKKAIEPITAKLGEGLCWIYMNILVPLAEWTIEDALPAFIDLLAGAFSVLNGVLGGVMPILQILWNNILQPMASWTGGVVVTVIEALAVALGKVGTFLDKHPDLATGLIAFLGGLAGYHKVLNPFITGMEGLIENAGALKLGISALAKGAKTSILSMVPLPALVVAAVVAAVVLIVKNWDTIKAKGKEVWDFISAKGKEFLNGLITGFQGFVDGAKKRFFELRDSVTSFFTSMGEKASAAVQAVRNVFGTLGQFFEDTFRNAWTRVQSVFSAGGKIFSGIKEGIETTFRSIVNKLISGINTIVEKPFNKINSMLNSVRSTSVLGIEPFKNLWKYNPVSVPQIPYLASGAVIPPNAEFAAILGDQKHGNNLEAPEGLIRKIVREESGAGMPKEITINVPVVIDGREVYTVVARVNEDEIRTTGRSLIRT